MTTKKLMHIYQLLWRRYGPQHWWPGQSRLEVIVGAILTQNTNWSNVEKAIGNLKAAMCLSEERLHNMDTSRLAELIRPAGYYNVKARRLKNFLDWLFVNFNGQLEKLENLDTEVLRSELLSIKGIGPETADSILLYAFGKNVFVIDAYTWRVVSRHGVIQADADYEQLRQLFESNLPDDNQLFNEYHALLVRVGKEYCRPKAKCQRCPLEKLSHDVTAGDF